MTEVEYNRIKSRIYREAHRDEINARQRERYAARTEEQIAKHRDYCRLWQRAKTARMTEDEKEARRVYQRERYARMTAEEKEKARAYHREFYRRKKKQRIANAAREEITT